MDISKLHSERISPYTQLGIIEKIYPSEEKDVDIEANLEKINYKTFPFHARAFLWNNLGKQLNLKQKSKKVGMAQETSKNQSNLEGIYG